MSFPKNDRKVRSGSGNGFPPDGLTNQSFATIIAVALKEEFGGGPSAVKHVARLTGANQRAARNWLEAKNGPSGVNLVALIYHSDAVLNALLSMSNRQHLLAATRYLQLRAQLVALISSFEDLDAI